MTARIRSATIARAVSSIIGIDEFFMWLALTGVTVGLWPRFGREALIVPSVVLLWIHLPQRVPFFESIQKRRPQ